MSEKNKSEEVTALGEEQKETTGGNGSDSDVHPDDGALALNDYKETCIFCRIAVGKEDNELLLNTERYVGFADRRPAADHHYLIVTKKHIRSLTELTEEDIPMIREMEQKALTLLRSRGADITDHDLGFHWPLFSIGHLHLHAISPTNQKSLFQKIEFGSMFFGNVEKAVEMLKKKKKATK